MTAVPASLRIATRSSPLARWQSTRVAELLAAAARRDDRALSVSLVTVDTLGDRTQALGTPLHRIGGQGVFVKEVQAAVLDGRADLAVHSAKDLPSSPTPGLTIAAVPVRDDVRDGLVGSALDALGDGAVVATGSVRRRAQLAHLRPDLRFVELRGNMATRVAKADEPGIGAVVVGVAGLDRLGLGYRVEERLDPVSVSVPQIAQAAIAVECRSDDAAAIGRLAAIDDAEAHLAVLAERAFLARLGSGCTLPVAAWCRLERSHWALTGLIASAEGHKVVRGAASRLVLDRSTAALLGSGLADDLLRRGGAELLGRAGVG
jgi:hydroxymethylbilane synthase